MDRLWIAVATCALVSRATRDWWREYEEGTRHYSKDALTQEFPEKTRPVSFKHPVFECPDMSPSPSVPNSELVKAADIKVIAALGDSLTIGGYGSFQDVITLAIIRLFNPGLVGASPGKTVHGLQAHISDTGFNLAVTGHNTNLPGQTRNLIDTLRGYEQTLFSVDNFIHYMSVSLEMLMNEVPRLIVNVVQILPMRSLREVQRPSPGCLLQSFCSCLVEPVSGSAELKELMEVNLEFQDGSIDMSFFTHDCFHFTIKGHEELAKGLWNNM
uniref:Uncharacterized protein n=1 Tax=Periophthalmus magnuspinnatus TaxID=409849 RepID=A0A3B4ASI3_9GOBI